jgi:hypothetical protein
VCCECCGLSGGGLCAVSVVCCQGSEKGRSLVHMSPIDCGVSEYDHETSTVK